MKKRELILRRWINNFMASYCFRGEISRQVIQRNFLIRSEGH